MEDEEQTALREIHASMRWCNFCTRRLAVSFIDEIPTKLFDKLKATLWFIFCTVAITALIVALCARVVTIWTTSTTMAESISGLHIIAYALMSVHRLFLIWSKRQVFRKLLLELVKIWPASSSNDEETAIKEESLNALRIGQFWYTVINVVGVSFCVISPIAVRLYCVIRGIPTIKIDVWFTEYPFDKSKPINFEIASVFESFGGFVAIWAMLGSDLMFTTMASHISMLLRVLQVKIRSFANSERDSDAHQTSRETQYRGSYEEIVSLLEIHHKLINYTNDLEDVFSMVNLITVLVSSINICFAVFNIVLLQPWMKMGDKFFLGAVLTEVGIICWYADDVYRTSLGVSDAVYESGWYKSNIRCRRALLLMIQRSQKPLCFTAFKFRNITMTTYSSILTNAYSYFTLLYTIFRE